MERRTPDTPPPNRNFHPRQRRPLLRHPPSIKPNKPHTMKKLLTLLLTLLAADICAAEKPLIRIHTDQTDLLYRIDDQGRLCQSYLGPAFPQPGRPAPASGRRRSVHDVRFEKLFHPGPAPYAQRRQRLPAARLRIARNPLCGRRRHRDQHPAPGRGIPRRSKADPNRLRTRERHQEQDRDRTLRAANPSPCTNTHRRCFASEPGATT